MQEVKSTNAESELKSKKLQLHWLLQITKAINYNMAADQLFEIYKNVLRDHLHVGKIIMFLYEKNWQQILSYGVDYHHFNIDAENDFAHLAEINPGNRKSPEWMSEFETIIPVFHNDKPLAYALIGDYSKMEGNSKEIIPFIHTITNIIVVAIENKRLTKEYIKQAALQREMELAADMQSMLIPEFLDGHNVFDIAATYLPHQEVGGDYYDYFKLNDDESIICMADVSGKGLAAALLMSNFQANLHALAKSTSSLTDLVHALNATVFKSAKGEKYITVFVARIHHKTKIIQYINAGHNPPLLFHAGNFQLLETGTTGLGMFEELPFVNDAQIIFPGGAMLFCYTDGITELEDGQGNSLGMENIMEMVNDHSAAVSVEHFHSLMIHSLNEFRKDAEYMDDVTLLTIRSIAH